MEIFITAAFFCAPPKLRCVDLHETSFFFSFCLDICLTTFAGFIPPSSSRTMLKTYLTFFSNTQSAGKIELANLRISRILSFLWWATATPAEETLWLALLYFLIILRSFERPSETLKKFHRILRIVRKWILSAIKICQLLTVVPNSSTCRSTIKKVAFCCFRNLCV